MDGDGASEIVCNNTGAGATDIQVRKWSGGSLQAAETWKASWCTGRVSGGDFNGDGKTDLLCDSAPVVAFAGTGLLQADLMASASNGLGGTTQVGYSSSVNFANTNNPPPKYAVTSLVKSDGLGSPVTTGYTYLGGYYDRGWRRFAGFRTVRETKPCLPGEALCPYVETTLNQSHLASYGKVEQVDRRSGNGNLLDREVFEYTPNGPYVSLLTARWTQAFDGQSAGCTWPCTGGKRTHSTFTYDLYGNVTQTVNEGDVDASGDETTVVTGFVANTGAYVVDRPAYTRTHLGGAGGPKLTETLTYYDGAGTWNQPPSQGYPTTVLRWLDTDNRYTQQEMAYDAYGNLTSLTELDGSGALPSSRTITTAYDSTAHLFPVSVTNGTSEPAATAQWDAACGVPLSATNPNGQPTSFQTDAFCRPSLTTYPSGAFEARFYLAFGTPGSQRVRVETPSGSPEDGTGNDFAESYFDGLWRTYRTVKKGPVAGVGIVTDQTFNARGGVAASTAPYYANETPQSTSFAYDAWDRPTLTTLPDGRTRATSYGLWTSTSTDENGKQSTTRRSLTNPLQTLQDRYLNGQPVTTTSSSDVLGRLVGMSDALGHTWSWSFDSLGRNWQKSDPDAGTWSFEYDDAGRLILQTDAAQQQTSFAYDSAGRLTTKTNAAGTVATTYSEARGGFYNVGLPTTVISPGTALKLDYDVMGRPVAQTRTLDGLDYVLARSYDSAGFLRGITYPDGDSLIGLAYDAVGRLKSVPGILSSVTYDAAGRPLVQTNANGTVTTRTYSQQRGWLTRILTTPGTPPIQDLQYAMETPGAVGLVSEVTSTHADEGWAYQYDDLYRLTQANNTTDGAQSQTWTYDSIGRITYNSRVGNYTYNPSRPHAPTTAGPNSYSYDLNGNLYSGAGRSLAWDADNRITQATVGSTTASFAYDAFGERLKKTTGTNSSLYPLGDDYEVTNGLVTKYVSIEGLGVIAKRVGPVGSIATFWLHGDRLGSINAVTDAAGAEVLRKMYRPYGETLAQSGSNAESRGWIDQRNDAETGLTYLHARYYDPALGAFLSPDPIGVAGGLHLYGYGSGNPINRVDRSGLDDGDDFDGPEWDDWWCREFPETCYDRIPPRWTPPIIICAEDPTNPACQPRDPGPCSITNPSGCDNQQPPPVPTPGPCPSDDPDCCPDGGCGSGPGPGPSRPSHPTEGGPPFIDIDPFRGSNPGGVFDPPDPNDLLRRPVSRPFGSRFDDAAKWWPSRDPSSCTAYPPGSLLRFVCVQARKGPIANSIRGCLLEGYVPGFGYPPIASSLPLDPGFDLRWVIRPADQKFGIAQHAYCWSMGPLHP